jgi:hypothetical protein
MNVVLVSVKCLCSVCGYELLQEETRKKPYLDSVQCVNKECAEYKIKYRMTPLVARVEPMEKK